MRTEHYKIKDTQNNVTFDIEEQNDFIYRDQKTKEQHFKFLGEKVSTHNSIPRKNILQE